MTDKLRTITAGNPVVMVINFCTNISGYGSFVVDKPLNQ